MRWSLIVAGLALAAGAWLKRDVIVTALQPAPAPVVVFKTIDAAGAVHYGDSPQAPNAKQVKLAPLTVIKGATAAEIDAAKKVAATPPQATACELEDAEAQARCIRAQMAPRNLALERMQQAAEKLTKNPP